jgi:hypothetical protein
MPKELLHLTADAAGTKLVSVAIGSLATAAVGAGRRYAFKKLPARRLWRYAEADNLTLIVASSAQINTGRYNRPTTGIGQARAMSLIVPSLTRAYRNVDLQQVRLSANTPGKDLETDLLVLGGAKTNEITGKLLDSIPNLPFTAPGEVIIWNNTAYEGMTVGENVVHDYGYIVRATNPFDSERRVVILAGSHTFGTVAAARWLLLEGAKRSIPANVAVLVEADVMQDGHVAKPKMVHQYPVG